MENLSRYCKADCTCRHCTPIQIKQDGGNKFDGGKSRVDLVDPLFIESTANGMTYGAGKYGENNWRQGIMQSRVYGALLRHLFAYWQGTEIDKESGNHHLDHAACMLMMLNRYAKDKNYADKDDRPTMIVSQVVERDYDKIAMEQPVLADGRDDLTPSDSERPCLCTPGYLCTECVMLL